MDETKGRDIFLGVIGVLTLVVAIVGATFAYFSTQVNSAEDAVNLNSYQFATSMSFKAVYPTGDYKKLIPLASTSTGGADSTTYLDKALSQGCVDEKGYQVCAVYEATLNNTADEVVLSPSLSVSTNEFVDKSSSNVYALLATANGSETNPTAFTYKRGNATNVIAASNPLTLNDSSTVTLGNGATAKYYLILWLENVDGSQPDMNKNLQGQLVFSSASGAQLQGTFNFE